MWVKLGKQRLVDNKHLASVAGTEGTLQKCIRFFFPLLPGRAVSVVANTDYLEEHNYRLPVLIHGACLLVCAVPETCASSLYQRAIRRPSFNILVACPCYMQLTDQAGGHRRTEQATNKRSRLILCEGLW